MYKEGIDNKNVTLPSLRYFETSNGHLSLSFQKER